MDRALHGNVYGYTWLLDSLTRWDALVLGDYEALMPLPWNRKYGFYYIYPPYFMQQLGIYAPFEITSALVTAFIQCIPSRFRLVEILLNSHNPFIETMNPGWKVDYRKNFLLDLSDSYAAVSVNYNQHTLRQIRKATRETLEICRDVPVRELIALHRKKMRGISRITEFHYRRFHALADFALQHGHAIIYGVRDTAGKLMASAFFLFSPNRAHYLVVGNAAEGRMTGASHMMVDRFIRDHSQKGMMLDFTGSNLAGLAFFYRGFGAREELYPFVYQNRLPWPLRLLKRT
jgi:hypothetical protein